MISEMRLWPSRKQWQAWSLPSKLTAIGTLIGILSLGLYVTEKALGLTRYFGSRTHVTARPPEVALEPGKTKPEVELAPFVLVQRWQQRIESRLVEGTHYGLVALVRVLNKNPSPEFVRALEIVGDVSISYADFEGAYLKDGDLIFSRADEYHRRKPYIRLSWVAWPEDNARIEPGDEAYVRFVIAEPASYGMVVYGDEPRNYLGFGDGSKVPSILTTSPALKHLVYFSSVGNDGKDLLGPRLRDEVASAKVQFRLRLDAGRVVLSRNAIQPIRRVMEKDWKQSVPQELFFRTDFWNRTNPVEIDPLIPEKP